MDKDKILIIALVVMILFASIQAVQLFGIKKDIKEGGLSVSTSTAKVQTSSGSSSSASVDILADIPDQVGGCF